MKSYRDLEIYKEAKRLAVEVHALTLTLPKFEMYEEGSQVRKSSKSVPAMIVEGYGRKRYKADFIKYLTYAIAECDETIFHLEMLMDTKSLRQTERGQEIINSYDILSKRINKFIQWVEEHFNVSLPGTDTIQEPELMDW
jgi:four helix bundle protein